MPIKKSQLDKIEEIIKKYTDWFTNRLLGKTYTESPKQVHINESILPDIPVSVIELSFNLGVHESLLKESEWKKFTYEELIDKEVPVPPVRKLQVRASELAALSRFRGLADDIKNGLFDKLSRASQKTIDESQVRNIIKDNIKLGVQETKNVYEVQKDLANDLKELKRNWVRVASTEMHLARQTGVAAAIISKTDIYKDSDGIDSEVTISLAPDACRDCQRIYTDGGKPKIFKLKELLDNSGSNYQRPWRQNAMPVIPPLHPHCFCRTHYVPPGWGYNDKGRFTLIDPNKAVEKMKKAIDNEPHSLLQASHAVLPEESYIRGLKGPGGIEELNHLIPRLEKLKEMYVDDKSTHDRLEDLLHAARAVHYGQSVKHIYHKEDGKNE